MVANLLSAIRILELTAKNMLVLIIIQRFFYTCHPTSSMSTDTYSPMAGDM
jgi:hypothetical protein